MVPEDRRVPLVAMRLRGHAITWWQQLKLSRSRLGKDKINSWEKIKKHMCSSFLPHNYQRLNFSRLYNLRQDTHTMKKYTTEF